MKSLFLRLGAVAAAAVLLTSAYFRTSSASVITEPANRFLASLTAEQRAKATFQFADAERVNWFFIPIERKGLPLREMGAFQRLHQVMLSVCMVFMNRAQNGSFNGDLYENAYHWLIENPPSAYPDTRDPQFQQLLSKLDAVTSGLVPDRTGGAIYFVNRNQMEVTLPEPYKITTTIGQMAFIR